MNILTVQQTRQLDSRAERDYGIPTLQLMEKAGESIANRIVDLVNQSSIKPDIYFFCGKGNNAGDGFVAARHLSAKKIKSSLILLADPSQLKGDALTNFQSLDRDKVSVKDWNTFVSEQAIHQSPSIVVVDALLGTGFKPPLKSPFETAIQLINTLKNSTKTVISVDIPSGLSGDHGYLDSPCVSANETLTFAVMKKGLMAPNCKKFVGKVTVIDIGIPQELVADVSSQNP